MNSYRLVRESQSSAVELAVAELVKSFGGLSRFGDASESLDDFRYMRFATFDFL